MRPVSHGTVLQFFGRPSFGQGMVGANAPVRLPGIAPGSRAWHARILLLDYGRMLEPKFGVAPKPTVYETVALLLSYEGVEQRARPARTRLQLQREDSNLHLSH